MYVIKVACRVKGNMTWTTKQQLLSIILAKNWNHYSSGTWKVNERLGNGNIQFVHSNLATKMT